MILKELPPNYELIKTVFPNCEERKAVFTYGENIYNPFNANITPDIEYHESIHTKQQGSNIDEWWLKYCNDKVFRLEQEIEAYGEQLAFAVKNGVRGKLYDWIKEKLAQALSGELYGNMISYQEAESRIRHYAKNIN